MSIIHPDAEGRNPTQKPGSILFNGMLPGLIRTY